MNFQLLVLFIFTAIISGCLQTRNEAGSVYQSQTYRKKTVENQKAEAEATMPQVDERDETIRSLNGRVESLENQLVQLQKDKQNTQSAVNPDSQKVILLQEALSKMELQIQKLENEKNTEPPSATVNKKSSDANIVLKNEPAATGAQTHKNQTLFEVGEDLFKKKEWKKAILSYQSYVEQFPKGKSIAESKYKIGVCFQELGLKDEATAFYEEVFAQYPKSEAGKKSKIRLTSFASKKAVK